MSVCLSVCVCVCVCACLCACLCLPAPVSARALTLTVALSTRLTRSNGLIRQNAVIKKPQGLLRLVKTVLQLRLKSSRTSARYATLDFLFHLAYNKNRFNASKHPPLQLTSQTLISTTTLFSISASQPPSSSKQNYCAGHVSIVVKAGSRYESRDNLGVSHLLRNIAGMGTKESTAFGLTRTMQQSGVNYTCSTSREFITYQIDCLRDELDNVIGMVKNAMTIRAFKPWEIKETAASMTLDKAILKTQLPLQVFELLHYAAFRNTLGNSIYVSDSMIGKFSSKILHQLLAIVDIGVDHEHLQYLVDQFQCSPSSGFSDAKAKYYGGEIRVEAENYMATATVLILLIPKG
uniref:Peptidase M16 N-terminal domain-containing protein n=1 Tax=Octopus bimaculoides TaxID=37653 RepID=A0A0L8GRP7_OCTBM